MDWKTIYKAVSAFQINIQVELDSFQNSSKIFFTDIDMIISTYGKGKELD